MVLQQHLLLMAPARACRSCQLMAPCAPCWSRCLSVAGHCHMVSGVQGEVLRWSNNSRGRGSLVHAG